MMMRKAKKRLINVNRFKPIHFTDERTMVNKLAIQITKKKQYMHA